MARAGLRVEFLSAPGRGIAADIGAAVAGAITAVAGAITVGAGATAGAAIHAQPTADEVLLVAQVADFMVAQVADFMVAHEVVVSTVADTVDFPSS